MTSKFDYSQIAQQLIQAVNGKDNITDVYHCATRLRVVVQNPQQVNQEALAQIPGIKGVVVKGNEIQNFVGTKVDQYYNQLLPYLNLQDKSASLTKSSTKMTAKTILSTILDFISGIVLPIMPVIVAAGFLLAILNMCKTFFGMNPKSGTAIILNSIASAGFYFIPIFTGFQAASKMKIPAAMGAFLGAILTFGDINNVAGLSFLGIHLPKMQYNGTLLTSILGVIILDYIYKFWDHILPKEITYFFTPLLSILIAAPLTLVVVGPISNSISFGIAGAFNWLSARASWLAFTLYSALNPILVMFGIDKGFVPIAINNVAQLGYETLIYPAALPSNAAMGAAALAVAVASKKKMTKGEGFSAGFTGLMGITEPSIFGFLLPYRRALIGAIAGGAIGGLIGGILHIKQGALMAPGFISLISYFVGPTPKANFIFGVLSWICGIVASFTITTILIKTDSARDQNILFQAKPETQTTTLTAPATGNVLPLTQVADELIASKTMGDGFAIMPTDNQLYAPVTGTVTTIFPTKHAVGFQSDSGLEILLHVGIDTVELDGKPFHWTIQENERVQQGQEIGTMDLELIKASHKDPMVMTIITNSDKLSQSLQPKAKTVVAGATVLNASKPIKFLCQKS
ncbi:glucose PTS transporter subunit IIA [Bombilactobacillus folatiphilus]|uniref:Glucose PTS transporter subunit IIA n=1 Tax=Bombilactobacillus folatiphilus TaxID=2923362 RepID=A0ABY4P7W3_9LACO|nr:glucose PTS transporter subunit IIA [Bombilactobacillus folatiphilus]UQS81784.1 glucose PTS transporter subunit IIA [Bombilactobacillus folatiphilus]